MNLSRQSGILPRNAIGNNTVTIYGVGAVGSFTGLILGKMGIPNIVIYDPDIVDACNHSSQNYRPKIDDDKLKVDAFSEIMKDFTTANIAAFPRAFHGEPRPKGYVICAVDSMEARIEIWQNAIRYNMFVPLYIESRMGGEELHLFAINPTDPNQVNEYEKTLHSSSKAFQEDCTAKAIAYTSAFAAGMISRELKAHLTGEDVTFLSVLGIKSRMWLRKEAWDKPLT